MTTLPEEAVEAFRSRLDGRLVTPDDLDYDTVRAVWNGGIDHRPALIAQCASTDDVVGALAFARDEHLEISVRGGGHSTSGNSVCPGGLVIDLSPMNAVEVDPDTRTARCGGGAVLAELDAATQAYGLAVPAGTVSHTGVGGLTLGGGFGWLTRMHGLTADNLLSADVVLADGRCVRASQDAYPDLFWALTGGGGNFGVVTAFTFRLHPVGPEVPLAIFFWDMGDGEEALRLVRDTVPGLPEATGVLVGIGLTAPPQPFVPPEHRGKLGHALLVAGFGSAEEHAEAIAPLANGVPRLFETRTTVPYTGLQSILDDWAPRGILAYETALTLRDLNDDVIGLLGEYLPRKSSPMTFCPTFHLGGAFTSVPEDATAFGGVREPTYVLDIWAVSPDPEWLVADTAWARALWTELLPHAATTGGYVNFMAESEEDRVRASYGPEKYARLAGVKATYDPRNVFHRNANILPAPTDQRA
ncbi:FAD-binding oxidoreductase [Streptomyces ficellus]|uniref:FAD-binding oxidoreductase n=1 Tax=Streptomyces ficellus TaxID=1977088 RepID=A0ABT7YZA3_9ACTN|nr:FAD-binding oxidoreductase [Streptomyces ficellus]MDN3292540.1 FAD-binding oxidoreductase [Streptomyces ficellus]